MTRVLIAGLIVLLFSGGAAAEEGEGWNLFAKTGLALTQSSFSNNWTGSETGAVAWTWTFLGEAERQMHPRLHWSNALKMDFGQTHQQDKATGDWAEPIKSTDRIRFDTVFRFTLGTWVDPYLAGFLKTQFYDERPGVQNEPINPILVSESGGVARAFLDEKRRKLVTRVGFAFRQLSDAFSPDTTSASGYGRQTTNDGGIEWVTDWRFATEEERTVYLSKLTVFRALFFSESDNVKGTPEEDYWKAADVDWENTLTNKLTDYLSLDFYFQWVYDKQQDKSGQYKQTLGVGLVYQFL